MERNSVAYKLRRKGQTIAFTLLSHEALSKLYYRICLHKKLNLKNPKTFNEKLQWYKLYYCADNQLIVDCTDKYHVRDYLVNKGYQNLLTGLLGVWDNTEDIDWESLPNQFVMKCTHGCAYNIICTDKTTFDFAKATKQLNNWLREDFSRFNVELHYGKIKPKIICEEFLGEAITDYKFFCFNGNPEFFYVSTDLVNDRQAEMAFFDMDGSKIPLVREDYKDIGEVIFPDYLNDMIEVSKKLSSDFPFVRVDFFITNDSFKFAELTFTPGAGMIPINPIEYDIEWGKKFKLPKHDYQYGRM
ncbi:ATP-grasp fold amidoligase family protein [Streptococcus pasteurianus]|uniref:ATP-grasp fold amidoligase family protein n=1 Tax=Streptococcus pasteurianus TaxID=197614 RepID=UPI003013B328